MPHILVVDDDRAIQELFTDVLVEAGYRVDTCRDGNEVIDRLEEGIYDLLILDLLIPHKNGFTLIEEMRSHPILSDIPVVMVSGIYRSRNHKSEMVNRFGVLDYLDKPVATATLLDKVEKIIGPGSPDSPDKAEPQSSPVLLTQPKREGVAPTVSMTSPQSGDERLVGADDEREHQAVEAESRSKFVTSAMVLQGSVRRNPVAAVLGQLWRQQRSGALLLRRGKVRKIVYLKTGNAFAVRSNLVGECLGQLLVRERLISKSECLTSIEKMRESGQRQGEILVAMRSMTEKNLAFALELQLETKIFEAFAWQDGEFRFNAAAELPQPTTTLEYQGAAVVTEGIRRAFDETRLRGLMLPILDVPLAAATASDQAPLRTTGLGLTRKEQQTAAGFVFPASTEALLDVSPLDPPDTLRVVYTLIALQLLAPQP